MSERWKYLCQRPMTLLGVVIVLGFCSVAILAPVIAPYDPLRVTPDFRSPPSVHHLFGTDSSGLDVFSRVIYGARLDLAVGVAGTLISLAIGLPLALVIGYYQNPLSGLLLRALDLLQALPVFVLALATVAMAGASLVNIIIVIGVLNVPVYIRLVRSRILTLRELPMIDAAKCVGNSDLRILFKYVLPNAIEPALVQASVNVGWAILLTASLSFIGAGLPVPTPEWGAMVAVGASMMVTGQWWAAFFPGLAIGLSVFGFAALGDGIRDVLNPETRSFA